MGGEVMLVGNKTAVPEQAFFKQILFDLIEGVYEVLEDKKNSTPLVYTISEVAQILKCKPKTIETHLYEKKDLPYLKVGREVRIREEDLKEFLENSLTPPEKVRSLK